MPAFRNDDELLRELRAWVQHWIEDVDAGLKPTRESLEAALAKLDERSAFRSAGRA